MNIQITINLLKKYMYLTIYFAVDVKKQKHFHNGMFFYWCINMFYIFCVGAGGSYLLVTSIIYTILRFYNNAHKLGNTFDFILYRDDKLLFVYLSDLFRQLYIHTTPI